MHTLFESFLLIFFKYIPEVNCVAVLAHKFTPPMANIRQLHGLTLGPLRHFKWRGGSTTPPPPHTHTYTQTGTNPVSNYGAFPLLHDPCPITML